MHNLPLLSAFVMVALVPGFARAQQPPASAERGQTVADTISPTIAPAEFVLRNRRELALTDVQVVSIEKVAAALRDSNTVRQARMRDLLTSGALMVPTNQLEWSDPVDEGAIRENARRQADRMAESSIERARDRRMIGALLTKEQHVKLRQLERADMMARAARRRGG